MKSTFSFFLLLVQIPWMLAIDRGLCSSDNQGRIDTHHRLEKLRSQFKHSDSIDGYIITNYDEHQSQELEPRDRRLQYISGFAGKKGVAVVTKDKAAIWVDNDEIDSANETVSCEWVIYSLSNSEISMEGWLMNHTKYHHRVGINPTLMPFNFLSAEIQRRVKFVRLGSSLVDSIWPDRPPSPKLDARTIDRSYTGKQWIDKVTDVRNVLKQDGCDAMVFTALDEIAWLLNIRAMHVNRMPVLKAYLLLSDSKVELFTDLGKLHSDVHTTLMSHNCFNNKCVKIRDYKLAIDEMKTFTQIWRRFCIPDVGRAYPGANLKIFDSIPSENRIIKVSPILKMKAIKNEAERVAMRSAHLRDASVFCDMMGYLEDRIKREMWNEDKVATFVDGMRKEQADSTGISYETLVGIGPHSAYKYYISNETTIKIDNSSVFTIDSGGQYLDGTTSSARTFHFGTPSDEQIDAYTRVLKGLIDFSAFVFPQSLPIQSSDALARAPLWEIGYDYKHPTGYGIGSHLAAEEGPILIDRIASDGTFDEGNFIVVGPSYSKPGQFGIKLKNVLEVVRRETFINKGTAIQPENSLAFRTTTLIPFEPKLINLKLLSPEQVDWINLYNTRIRNELGAQLKKERRDKGFYWMMEKAQNIPRSSSTSLSQFQIKPVVVLTFSLLLFPLF